MPNRRLIRDYTDMDRMKKTLVLVVDRDDDFGVKGKVNTPVIGVQNCLDAATAFGIADPEDSDLNALYAAVSVCLEIQEDGHEADVALICGDQKVGHRSDLALVSQLDEVLDRIEPDSVVLVGDGAEDEYIYPIISSRANVDSVKKVYVQQSPGLEGSFYIITKMLSDPGKRKRFLVPLGFILVLLSMFFIMPSMLVYFTEHNISTIADMSGSMTVCFIGVILLLYGYNVGERYSRFRHRLFSSLTDDSTRLIFFCVAISIILVAAVWNYIDVCNMYSISIFGWVVRYASSMVWPVIIGFEIYVIGDIIQEYQVSKVVKISPIFGMIGLASLGLVGLGLLDTLLFFIDKSYSMEFGLVEIAGGLILSVISSFMKARLIHISATEDVPDETV